MGTINYAVTIQYDGTKYDGWQKQGNTSNTIQGKLEQILKKLSGRPVEVQGSGRTDAGVHALAQTANFKLETSLSNEELKGYINQYLPEDIAVISIAAALERFHSRLSAKSKTYCYQVEKNPRGDVFERKYVYCLGVDLNIEAMRQAAKYFVGQHDFSSFNSNKKLKKSTIRTICHMEIQEVGTKVRFIVSGNGFLHHMVRIISGTLIEVGLGKRTPESIKEILEGRDRALAGFTAPPQGLFLVKVDYE